MAIWYPVSETKKTNHKHLSPPTPLSISLSPSLPPSPSLSPHIIPDTLGSSPLFPSHSPFHSGHKMAAVRRASWRVWPLDSTGHTFCHSRRPRPGKCQLPQGPCTRPNRQGWRGWAWSWGCGYCSPCYWGQSHRYALESPMKILLHHTYR